MNILAIKLGSCSRMWFNWLFFFQHILATSTICNVIKVPFICHVAFPHFLHFQLFICCFLKGQAQSALQFLAVIKCNAWQKFGVPCSLLSKIFGLQHEWWLPYKLQNYMMPCVTTVSFYSSTLHLVMVSCMVWETIFAVQSFVCSVQTPFWILLPK